MIASRGDDPHRFLDRNPHDALGSIDPAIAGKRHPLFMFEPLQIVLRLFLQRWLGKLMFDSPA